mgnify:CR=1 FL=1
MGNILMLTMVLTFSEVAPPKTQDVFRCGPGNVQLSAKAGIGAKINWHASQTGGALMFTGENFTTPALTKTATYWVSTTDTSGSSSSRIKVVAGIHEIPELPTFVEKNLLVQPGQACTLSVTEKKDRNYKWYSTSIGGSIVFTGPSYSLTAKEPANFFVTATTPEGCISDRAMVQVQITQPVSNK